MGLEIERKFLLAELPGWLDQCESDPIRQGYVALDGDTEVRVRSRGDERRLAVKHGGGLARAEVEVPIAAEPFDELWRLTAGRRVSKRRYVVPGEHASFEVDVYEDELEGLAVAEVEFASVEASRDFEPPAWLGDEVTDDPRFKNRHLAEHGFPAADRAG